MDINLLANTFEEQPGREKKNQSRLCFLSLILLFFLIMHDVK